MIVKVRRGYTLFVGNRRYTHSDGNIEIDAKTHESQSWKVELVNQPTELKDVATDRMMQSKDIKKKGKSN